MINILLKPLLGCFNQFEKLEFISPDALHRLCSEPDQLRVAGRLLGPEAPQSDLGSVDADATSGQPASAEKEADQKPDIYLK